MKSYRVEKQTIHERTWHRPEGPVPVLTFEVVALLSVGKETAEVAGEADCTVIYDVAKHGGIIVAASQDYKPKSKRLYLRGITVVTPEIGATPTPVRVVPPDYHRPGFLSFSDWWQVTECALQRALALIPPSDVGSVEAARIEAARALVSQYWIAHERKVAALPVESDYHPHNQPEVALSHDPSPSANSALPQRTLSDAEIADLKLSYLANAQQAPLDSLSVLMKVVKEDPYLDAIDRDVLFGIVLERQRTTSQDASNDSNRREK